MEALKFFIKEHKYLILLHGVCLFIGVLLLIYDIFRVFDDGVNKTMLRFFISSLMFFPALIFYFADFKKLVLVFRDYKMQKTETKNLYILSQDFKMCKDEFNGAYFIIHCSEDKNGHDCIEYWLYKKDLLYNNLKIGSQYKLTYYINSKCLCCIEPIVSNNIKTNKQKINKQNFNAWSENSFQNSTQEKLSITHAEQQKNKLWVILAYIFFVCTIPFSMFILQQLWCIRDIIDGFYLLFCIVCVSLFILYFLLIYKFVKFILSCSKTPKIVTEKFTTIGIPVMQSSSNSDRARFWLRVQNQKKRKKDLVLYGTDILGLGDLNERPGYMGYGNFIGTKYDVEYYKHSRVIKSMRLIEDETKRNTGEGSVK